MRQKAEPITAAVIMAPPNEDSKISRAVGERIGLAMMKTAVAEIVQLVADTGAAPRGVNTLHLVRAGWIVLMETIDVHPDSAHLWRGLIEQATRRLDMVERATPDNHLKDTTEPPRVMH